MPIPAALHAVHSKQQRTLSVLLPYLLPTGLVAFWEIAVRVGWWPETLIAPPSRVIVNLIRLSLDGTLFKHAVISLYRLGIGCLIGFFFGMLIGSFVGISRRAESVLALTFQVLAPIPVIAWIPLLIILFRIDGARIAVISVGTFFMLYFSTVQGIRSTDIALVELAKIYDKNSWQLWWEILFPSALPNIIDAARQALAIGWILLLAGEVIASSSGLGWLIWDSRNFARADDMIVGMITVGILGKVTDTFIVALQRRLLRWRRTFEGQ